MVVDGRMLAGLFLLKRNGIKEGHKANLTVSSCVVPLIPLFRRIRAFIFV